MCSWRDDAGASVKLSTDDESCERAGGGPCQWETSSHGGIGLRGSKNLRRGRGRDIRSGWSDQPLRISRPRPLRRFFEPRSPIPPWLEVSHWHGPPPARSHDSSSVDNFTEAPTSSLQEHIRC